MIRIKCAIAHVSVLVLDGFCQELNRWKDNWSPVADWQAAEGSSNVFKRNRLREAIRANDKVYNYNLIDQNSLPHGNGIEFNLNSWVNGSARSAATPSRLAHWSIIGIYHSHSESAKQPSNSKCTRCTSGYLMRRSCLMPRLHPMDFTWMMPMQNPLAHTA